MKKIVAVILTTCLLITACRPSHRTTASADNTIIMRVQCSNDGNTQRSVIYILKTGEARDIIITPNPGFVEIQATFVHVSKDYYDKFLQLRRQIRELPGVLNVQIKGESRRLK